MSRRLSLLLVLASSCALGQSFNAITPQDRNFGRTSAPSSPVEVVYVVDNSALTTYNIDPHTFQPTVAGTTSMPLGKYSSMVSSPNGQFLYYFANPTYYRKDQKLYVFDTDSTGVPASTPVQGVSANQLIQVAINPTGTFFYSVAIGPAGPQTTTYAIVRNVIDPVDGSLSQPLTEASYALDNNASANACGLEILGFNPSGTTLYDAILCSSPHASGSETFNQRTVNLQTGALGSDEQIYAFSYYAASGYAEVQFKNNFLFAFDSFFNQGPNANTVDIYQTQPYNATPLVNCTTSILAICGSYAGALAHPSGDYVFLGATTAQTDIMQVDLTTQQLVQVNTVPGVVEALSPDGSVIYGYNPARKYIHIAGFNAANAQVTLGGTIELINAINDFWIPAVRY